MSGSDPSHQAFLEAVCRAFGATAQKSLAGGGSGAHVTRLMLPDGSSVVAKYQSSGTALVDGHGPDALRQKVLQARMILQRLPSMAPYSATILTEFEWQEVYGFVMPYYEGQTITERMLSGVSDGREELETLLAVLIERGYAQHGFECGPGNFVKSHVHRVLRRLDLVASQLPQTLANAECLTVNGVQTDHARVLIERLLARRQLLARLEPRRLALPVHGDAVLSNFIWRGKGAAGAEFVAIDPRGELGPVDPAYDFAKIFFSLSIYDLAMAGGFSVETVEGVGNGLRVQVQLRSEKPNYRRAALEFFEVLEAAPGLGRLAPNGVGSWREKTLYATAMHCLAFAACSVADRRESGNAISSLVAKRRTVLGFYLAGVAMLGALLDADRSGQSLDVGSYLRILQSGSLEGAPGSRVVSEHDLASVRTPGVLG